MSVGLLRPWARSSGESWGVDNSLGARERMSSSREIISSPARAFMVERDMEAWWRARMSASSRLWVFVESCCVEISMR